MLKKTLILACVVAGLAGVATGQHGPAGVLGPPDQPFKERTATLSERLGVALPAQVIWQDVPPLDLARVLAEDAQATTGRLRLGASTKVTLEFAMGQWLEVPGGGWLWVMDVKCANVYGVRLHFRDFQLPKGAEMVVYDPAAPQNPSPIYQQLGPADAGEFWAWSSWSDRARVEVYYPPHTADERLGRHFVIDEVMQTYRNPATGAVSVYDARELGCHNDLACFQNWWSNGQGVGLMSFVLNGGSFGCSGSMLNAANSDFTPYFVTARHCMEDNTGALNSLEVYWFYQQGTCGGMTPALNTLPRSARSTYCLTTPQNDTSLVMIEGTIPRNLWWSNQNNVLPPVNTSVAGIHHPRSTRKRISFGSILTGGTCAATGLQNGFQIDFPSGTTEPGSSGSPLFQSSGHFIGVDSCGFGNCPASGPEAWYGAWASFAGNYSGWMAGGSDDSNEPNDSCGSATNLNIYFNGTLFSQWVRLNRDDWYHVTVPAFGTCSFHSHFTHGEGDIDMTLHDGCGAQIGSSTSTTNDETINWTNTTNAPREVYLRVYLFNDTRSIYYLDFARNGPVAPSNNTCSSAPDYTIGGIASGTTQGASVDGASGCANTATAPDVWHRFSVPCTRTVNLNTNGSSYDTVLSVHTGCPGGTGNQVACNDDVSPGVLWSTLDFTAVGGQTYYVRVTGYNGAFGNYVLRSGAPNASNDLCQNTLDLAPGTYAFNNCPCDTDGPPDDTCLAFGNNQIYKDFWTAFTPECFGTIEVNTFGSNFDTKVAVYANADNSSCPPGPNSAIACNDDINPAYESQVVFSCVPNQRYIIRVGSYAQNVGAPGVFRILYTPSNPCVPPATGSCCDGQWCSVTDEAECLARGGTWAAGLDCASTDCVSGRCGSPDFNHDGDVGTDQDIESYFACLGGSCCATCDTPDFNGDGDVGTDQDIEAFFRVLGGAPC